MNVMQNFRLIKNHFINSVIWRGKKITAENFFVSILFYLKHNTKLNPIDVFYYSLLSLRPLVFLRPTRVGSITYRIPAPISAHNRRLYAIKFLLHSARDSRSLVTVDRIGSLLNSIYLAEKNAASEKKFTLYKEAIDNRSFVYRIKF